MEGQVHSAQAAFQLISELIIVILALAILDIIMPTPLFALFVITHVELELQHV